MALKVYLVSIDNQNDFTNKNGSLYVNGADENVRRGAKMIKRLGTKLNKILATMDSHNPWDISHRRWYVDEHGKHPGPITGVTLETDDTLTFTAFLENGRQYKGRVNQLDARTRTHEYLKALTANGRYPHTIWPDHCIIGDEGHNFDPVLSEAFREWEDKRGTNINVVTKGSNPWTEHFSAVQAEVPDPKDPSTQVNRGFISMLEQADMIVWMGEARSHCLANTWRDVVKNFSDPTFISKMYLCTDATSDVPGFEKFGEDFIKEVKSLGGHLTTTTDFLA